MLSEAFSNQHTSDSNALLIHVRPDDSLLWSFPLWLICHRLGMPALLAAQAPAPHAAPAAITHRPPEVRLGTQTLAQLLTIIETLYEQFPHAGVWPGEPSARARARDACGGLLTLCRQDISAPLRADETDASTIAHVAHRLRSALDDDRHGAVASVAAATLVLDMNELFDVQSEDHIRAMLESPAASAWLSDPQVQERRAWTRGFNLASKLRRAGFAL
ncbi:hypothetical protein [Burkholderia sp. BCC0405]|uniref:hypothetical protein n=1 Tax=Burkholderia sp. BCC0405 TaxID=2676298 RepID=UPI0015897941|nr:hypothetical protein [Burkholderia sp. BCC0405]